MEELKELVFEFERQDTLYYAMLDRLQDFFEVCNEDTFEVFKPNYGVVDITREEILEFLEDEPEFDINEDGNFVMIIKEKFSNEILDQLEFDFSNI
jgi:hypothetical protein